MTIERARHSAEALDQKTGRELMGLQLGPPSQVLTQIRAYLQRRSDEMRTRNNPYDLLRLRNESGLAVLELGPRFDKAPTPRHFWFDSGARLCFGLTLREVQDGSQLVAFRYHYTFPDGHSVKFLRFDLNREVHSDALAEPRCHLHPGTEKVRLPFSVHHPIEILDRIFFVLERKENG